MSYATQRARGLVTENFKKDSSGDETFRYILRVKRAELDETKEEFAQRLGVTPKTLLNWEKNPSCISNKYIRQIFRKLNLPGEDLIRVINP